MIMQTRDFNAAKFLKQARPFKLFFLLSPIFYTLSTYLLHTTIDDCHENIVCLLQLPALIEWKNAN